GAADEIAREGGGDGPVAGQIRRSGAASRARAGVARAGGSGLGVGGVGVEEGGVGDDEPDVDRATFGGGLPSETFDQGVGHDLVAGALIAGGFGSVGVRS